MCSTLVYIFAFLCISASFQAAILPEGYSEQKLLNHENGKGDSRSVPNAFLQAGRLSRRYIIVPSVVRSKRGVFDENEFRTEAILPIMNIMGMGLSVFGNMYPVRSLRNDDGSYMNETQLRTFRSQMSNFQSHFGDLGKHLTAVVENSRSLRQPFQTLGRKIAVNKLMTVLESRKMTGNRNQ